MPRSGVFAALLVLALNGSPLSAQTVAIVNARVITMAAGGEIESGTIVIRDGVIQAVGAGLRVPEGIRTVDARGAVVTPGLIAADTQIVASDLYGGDGTYDLSAHSDAFSAAFDISRLVNPSSIVAPVIRAGGFTHAFLTPTYEAEGRLWPFAGQTAAIHLGESGEMLVKAKVAMLAQLRAPTPRSPEYPPNRQGLAWGATFVALATAFDEVRRYAEAPARWRLESSQASGLTRADMEALVPVIKRSTPLIVRVNKAAHIQQVLSFAREQKLRIILLEAQEGWKVAAEIAAAGVPAIINPTMTLPSTLDTLASRPENGALLAAAGVRLAFTGPSHFHRVREIRTNAGMAVAHGLSFNDALAALTINPATMFGLGDRFGSIEPGKEADLVVWSGDPLQALSWPLAVYIHGVEQPLRSRHQELSDRYRQRVPK